VASMFDFLTMSELLLCCGIVIFASILQVSIGMGFGMLASPLIALVKPELVPGSILAMGLFVAFTGAWRERKNISINELKLGVGGRIIGSIMAFGLLLLIPDVESFFVIFGVIMLLAIGMTAYGKKIPFSDKSLLNLSVVSGLIGFERLFLCRFCFGPNKPWTKWLDFGSGFHRRHYFYTCYVCWHFNFSAFQKIT